MAQAPASKSLLGEGRGGRAAGHDPSPHKVPASGEGSREQASGHGVPALRAEDRRSMRATAQEDIITELSRFSELLVIARNSSFQYKGKAVDIRQVGRELGALYILEAASDGAAIVSASRRSSSMP